MEFYKMTLIKKLEESVWWLKLKIILIAILIPIVFLIFLISKNILMNIFSFLILILITKILIDIVDIFIEIIDIKGELKRIEEKTK